MTEGGASRVAVAGPLRTSREVVLRRFLLILGWSSFIGSVADSLILLVAVWAVVGGEAVWGLSMEALLRELIPWLYWVKQVAVQLLPEAFVSWLFTLPALVYFPIRIVTSVLIGWWAFAAADRRTRVDEAAG